MRYQVASSGTDQCSDELRVIKVDQQRGVVMVGTSSEDLKRAYQQLNSEDAKSLALQAASKKGVYNPLLKHSTVVYGDDKKGVASARFDGDSKVRPFLIVEYDSEDAADMQFAGDSL